MAVSQDTKCRAHTSLSSVCANIRLVHNRSTCRSLQDRNLLEYYLRQMELFANLCRGRQYAAINYLTRILPLPILLRCIDDNRITDDIRAVQCRLLLHLLVRLWQPIDETDSQN
ncbi:unnamed protein product, partial [Dicrocoelium dendriticum]